MGVGWRNYDTRFCQQMAAGVPLAWTQIEPSIMLTSVIHVPSSSSALDPPCTHCGESNHKMGDRTLASMAPKQVSSTRTKRAASSQDPKVCRMFNRGSCPLTKCKYLHICSRCNNNDHGALSCPSPCRLLQGQGTVVHSALYYHTLYVLSPRPLSPEVSCYKSHSHKTTFSLGATSYAQNNFLS